ncbi:hypothetical protein [Novosphingobium sp. PhB165]|uniref:hypothetical protein n=1 Tax=Novosphingobium sp. PhB165 TaxID=2485105 RepID=UPI001404C1B3|nr:hypothetical protein [Novosphingobium sp. PhB165]
MRVFLSLLAAASLIGESAAIAEAPAVSAQSGVSPAACGVGDIREPGIQGEVPKGATANYNCGVKLVGQLPLVGKLQGVGRCAYIRPDGTNEIVVIDVSNPAKPVQVKSVPVTGASETMRAVVAKDRAILVSGNSVYDIRDCLNPVHLGDVKWPPLNIGASAAEGTYEGYGQLPHDLRLNRAATKIYASPGLWEADITNLKDPGSWKVTDYRCDLTPQIPGPWQELHRQALAGGYNLCDDGANPKGANNRIGGSRMQAGLLWPSIAHSLDTNLDGTRLYVGDQKVVGKKNLGETPKIRIIDLTQRPLKILSVGDGPGHGLDWFHAGGRDYVLHSNEWGTSQKQPYGTPGDTCHPYPRPTALGWGFEAFISEVTGDQARGVSMVHIAINDPQFCEVRKASGRDPWIAYHLIDNPLNAKFAAVNFGDAGLRIFDIRQPEKPVEVAYFNHGPLVHGGIGYYDASRGLIYAAGTSGFWVLRVEPQVKARLGL